jgi:asparagine synthase (glutamine-hydrolysing)
MCGIAGLIGPGASLETVRRMAGALAHRGPDDAGAWAEPGVALAHARLSILDLSPAGHQPMHLGPLSIVYNGEVYNYPTLRRELEGRGVAFGSASDTEVVLRAYEAWGLNVLGRLNGMFALAIWDRRERRLVLARDPVGIKPLFYAVVAGGLVFASEMKALLRTAGVSEDVDPDGVSDYFTLGYTLGERTVYRSIRKLLPGHLLLWCDGAMEVRRYWSPPGGPNAMPEQEAVVRLEELLARAVERHMISDVPLGAFLSGGVDSSLLVALMRKVGTGRVKTFSVGFRGMGLYDERPFARDVARLFETEHVECEVTPKLREDVAGIIEAFDEPFADSSAVPTYYLAKVTRRHVTVALSGTGGDDLFGGYRRHASAGLRSALARLPQWVRRGLAGGAALLPAHRRSRLAQGVLFARRALAARAGDDSSWYADLMTVIDDEILRSVAPSLRRLEPHPLAALLHEAAGTGAARYLAVDFLSYLPDDLLVKEDRMTMAHGLEARVPFLDKEVVEFAWSLPYSLKVRGVRTKVVLRRLALRWLPREIVQRPKHGFAVPVGEWFRGELRDMGRDVLFGRSSLLDRRALEVVWNRHQRREMDLGPQLWALFVYALWEQTRPRAGAAGA